MADLERTLCIVKPDAVEKGVVGEVLRRVESAGLRIVALRMLQLAEADARGFYAVHKERPFFRDLVAFMSSGPVVAAVLEGPNAIARWRELMGPTNSRQAPPGTIRGDLGTDVERNAAHGSDSAATARIEIAYFFNATEVMGEVEALPA